MKTFTVVYRAGGTKRCTWTRVADTFFSREAAQEMQRRIERQGYKALIFDTVTLKAVGLPIGWEPELVDYSCDYISAGDYQTYHSKPDAGLFVTAKHPNHRIIQGKANNA